MACGLGFCHGCAAGRPGLPAETPLVCRDGPVFRWARTEHQEPPRLDELAAVDAGVDRMDEPDPHRDAPPVGSGILHGGAR